MSDNIDFKALWNREEQQVPDINEVFARAKRLRRRTSRGLWVSNTLLLATAILYIVLLWRDHPQMLTTKIGMLMVVSGIAVYIFTSVPMLTMWKNANVESDTKQYLQQLIKIQQRQRFMNTTMTTIYFIMLTVGVGLYMMEYLNKAGVILEILCYGITATFMALAWFFFHPWSVKLQQKAMNNLIEKLKMINEQLDSLT